MIAPTLMLISESSYVLIGCFGAALTLAAVSITHLAHLIHNLELDLVLAGWEPPTGSHSIPW